MAEAVKVAVRVRPFNSRETSRKATVIIKMSGQSTEIKDPSNPSAEPKRFAFDHSYWSHDGFKEQPGGYLAPSNSIYADQKKVFDDLGKDVLSNAWKGYNCSLFAYGQTGSGKSYSMVGYGKNKGIVPISCEELFKEIEAKRGSCKKGEEYQVSFSMLEIYNEQVRDLLNPNSLKVKGGLKVRQHPKQGFYVEQLKSVPVHSYSEIEKKTDEGTKNRTVASTNMNATSSRAHTIVAINFTQKKQNDAGQNMTKTSIINLVDLAGSERADSTGATGDRLKEGANINKSLSSLGNCIKALADQSTGKKGVIVPFRDSVLTKLLMNALGGNSKTVMIAALSPADINYDETLSTLRFADRAKSVKTKAVVNESPTDKLIRELREENEKLKKMLESGQLPPGFGGEDGATADEIKQMEEKLRANQEEVANMTDSWEAKWAEREAQLKAELEAEKKEKEKEKTVPHLLNLNEDAALSGKIVHLLNPGKATIGSSKASKSPNITLAGLGVQNDHATIQNDKNKKIFLIPVKGARVLQNGNAITSKKELHHNDRLLFGNTNLFLFSHPSEKKGDTKLPTYDDAQEEIAKNSGLDKLTGNGKSPEDLLLHEDLVQIWPMISEANAMSEEMDKKVKFEIALVSPQARGEKHGRTHVCVKMKNLQTKNEFMWDRDTFLNRKYLMQEIYQSYVDGDNSVVAKDFPKEKDPFWEDPSTPIFIGCVHVYLNSLAYMIELEENLSITDYKGDNQGNLSVAVHPCAANGGDIGDDFVDEPEELIGKPFHFNIKVLKARGLPKQYKQTFCRYRYYLDDQYSKSDESKGMNPDFNFSKKFSYTPATKQFVSHLTCEPLIVEVWGRQEPLQECGDLNTQELMLRDNTKVGKQSTSDQQYKVAAETAMYKRRMERAETKMQRAIALVEKAKKANKTSVTLDEIDKALRSGTRLKAVANVIMQTKKPGNLTEQSSQACVLQ